jgi:putative ABC transport system permease protein
LHWRQVALDHAREAHVSAHWRKAPYALAFHRSALLAVFVAALLAGLAASSAPFVTTAAASEAMKNKLVDLSPLSTGLQITGANGAYRESLQGLIRKADAQEASLRKLAARLHLESPVFTTESLTLALLGPGGVTDVRLLARTGALAHVEILSKTRGGGVWISNVTANAAHLKPGGIFKLDTQSFGATGKVTLRVKGIFRSLDQSPESRTPYWVNFYRNIVPSGIDPSPFPPYLLLSRDQLFRVARTFAGVLRSFKGPGGKVFHFSSGFEMATTAELPVDPKGLTLSGARALDRQFAALGRQVAKSSSVRSGGCAPTPSFNLRPGDPAGGCSATSSLSSAVILADEAVSAISPAVTLLSDVGGAIALAVAAAAGVFLVRRRRVEAALLYARGEHVAVFSGRTLIEALAPTIAGGAAGFGLALALTDTFAPGGSIDSGTVWSGLAHAGAWVGAGLCLLVLAASAAFLRLYDTGARPLPWLRWVPWELPLLAVALYLLFKIRSGGGLVSSGGSGTHHPTLGVFVFPLLLVAAAAGAGARLARLALRALPGRTQRPPVFLALRRLAAARGLLVLLVVVSAIAFGAFFYAETLAVSLAHTTIEKAYMATGSDAQATIFPSQPRPASFPYPVTKVQFANQTATADGPLGPNVDVMLVDPATLAQTLHWQSDWGANPAGLLRTLGRSSSAPLPVIVTSDLARMKSLSAGGHNFPVRVLGSVRAFPAMAVGVPLVITSFRALDQVTRKARALDPLGVLQTYLWAKGPPGPVMRALAAPSLNADYVSSIDTFLRDPDVVLATRTFAFMRTVALAAAVLVLIGLLLYLQARQRSQAIASALARRMGFGRVAEIVSLSLELGAILLFAAVLGGGIAIAAAGPVVRHLDPLPQDTPAPIFVVPTVEILVAAAAIVVVTLLTGALTSWFASRTDVAEALRVD